MIVEDDDDIRASLSEMLQDAGVEVLGAPNGREALAMLHAGTRPTMILLDLMMPVLSGWDFRREQMNDPALRQIPVVVFSATGLRREALRAQLGDVELLPKPICVADLFRVIDRLGRPVEAAA
jgi:CheY-like chemotaxis protein